MYLPVALLFLSFYSAHWTSSPDINLVLLTVSSCWKGAFSATVAVLEAPARVERLDGLDKKVELYWTHFLYSTNDNTVYYYTVIMWLEELLLA